MSENELLRLSPGISNLTRLVELDISKNGNHKWIYHSSTYESLEEFLYITVVGLTNIGDTWDEFISLPVKDYFKQSDLSELKMSCSVYGWQSLAAIIRRLWSQTNIRHGWYGNFRD